MRNILNTFSENYLLCGGGGCFVKNYYYSDHILVLITRDCLMLAPTQR